MLDSIAKMSSEIVSILDGRICNIWLYGSVVMNDFRPGWSDIDFIALTDGKISEEQADRLLCLRQDMLKREPGNPYYRSFEGIIADVNEYRSRSFSRLIYWGTGGQRVTDSYTPDPFSEFELARYGEPLCGSDPWVLPEPERAVLIAAVRKHYDSIRKYASTTGESLYSCGWLLDIARCVYTLKFNDVIAKTQAGIWALEEHILPDEASLRRTVEIRRDPASYKDRPDIRQWLKGLGPIIQRCADVLEQELQAV